MLPLILSTLLTLQPADAQILNKKEFVTESGVKVVQTLPAEPIISKKGDVVLVMYRGMLEDGTEFDSSYKRNQPLTVRLGEGRVIKGWEEGLLGMTLGEKRTLTIPSAVGYGETGSPPTIPPNATLIFEVELLGLYRPPAAPNPG